ncbi:MAG: hypothetical protein R2783_09110 [Gelidibacter sp.]
MRNIGIWIDLISDGTYQIAIAAVDGIFDTENQPIYLKDHLLNITYDLRSYPYGFSSEAGTFNNCFELVFQPETLSIVDSEIPNSGLSIVELANGQVITKRAVKRK